jgi:hypothetical protein
MMISHSSSSSLSSSPRTTTSFSHSITPFVSSFRTTYFQFNIPKSSQQQQQQQHRTFSLKRTPSQK